MSKHSFTFNNLKISRNIGAKALRIEIEKAQKNETIMKEIESSKAMKKLLEQRQREERLFVYNNIDEVLSYFEDKTTISKLDLISKMGRVYSDQKIIKDKISQYIKNFILTEDETNYFMKVAYIYNPFKDSSYVNDSAISIKDYLVKENRANFRKNALSS